MSSSVAITALLRRNQMVGGVASVIQNLMRGISELVQAGEFPGLEVTVLHGPCGPIWQSDALRFREWSLRGGRFWGETTYGATLASRFDATLYTNYFTPPLARSRRNVTLLHDVLYRHFPDLVSVQKKAWLNASHRHTLRKADAVVTISQAVRDDVLDQYGRQQASKVVPIWNPIAFERLEGEEQESGALSQGRPYVLGVAVDRPTKNLYTLVQAFHRLRDRYPDHLLILAGELRSRRPPSKKRSRAVAAKMPPTVDLVRDLGLQDRVQITGFVSDATLGALYRGASLFVMPSLFEGFGMPAIESLAMRTPALVSDLPVLREVTLGYAHYSHDVRDDAALAGEMAQILDMGDQACPSTEVVRELRDRFSPQNIARQYLSLLLQTDQ